MSPLHAMGNGDCYHLDQVASTMKMATFVQHCQNNTSGGTDKVLTVTSVFDMTEVQKARHAQSKKASPQTHTGTAKLKNGTIGAGSCIPQRWKASACRMDFLTLLLDLVHTVWEEQRVPRDWYV